MEPKIPHDNQELDALYEQLKASANNPNVGWNEFSQDVQQFTRRLFQHKRMKDQVAEDKSLVSHEAS